jgi:hypothetical protein
MTRHDLEKMTVVKLREEALKFPELSGVHGMKKEELIDALAKLMGLPEEEKPKKKVKGKKGQTKEGLKKKIKALKGKRAEAIQVKDAKGLKIARKKIKRLKRAIRKIKAA